MTGFDTPFPPLAVILAAVALIAWTLGRRPEVGKRAGWGLAALRSVGIVLLALLLLNPFYAWLRPDPSGFAVAVVGDVSRSMEAADLPGNATRLSFVQREIDPAADNSLWQRLAANYALEPSSVAGRWQAGADWQARDGDTALGDGLRELLDARAKAEPPLGGVLLLSDGISLTGETLPEAALAWRDAGLPVSVIGVGEPSPPGDLSVAFTESPASAPLGEPLEMAVTVRNDFDAPRTVDVEWLDDERSLETRQVELPPHGEQTLRFSTVPDLPGLRVYRARLTGEQASDANPGNDVAYAAVDVQLPQTVSLLYVGARLSPVWRFLQIALEGDDSVALSAIIQTGPDNFYVQGIEAAEKPSPTDEGESPDDAPATPEASSRALAEAGQGFPADAEDWFAHSVLIVDIESLAAMNDEARLGLRDYLLRRGGGVLFLGDPGAMPAELAPLLPVRGGDLARALQRVPLELRPQPVFPDASGGVLGQPPGLYLPLESIFFQPADLSLGSRPALIDAQGRLPLLTVHAYGAGRVGFLGTESTWRWALGSARENEQHAAFWRQLVAWLATGGHPRVELPLQGKVVELSSPVPLDAKVRGADFLPSEDARVTAFVTAPDGTQLPPADLLPAADEPGRFAGELALDQPGEYRVDYRIEFPAEGKTSPVSDASLAPAAAETLDQTAYFVARRGGRENEDLRFRENALRDLARITGGRYLSWRESSALDELPLARDIPTREERLPWTRHPLFLFALLAVFGAEWLWRRQLGLR